ncbi:hypothetical protein BDF20DRAFT_862010 [Mycotypha africana]|uniref:uncharacterized protein n=1 Tax=Mycotypha africana TaxID=64632 RepID=UPI00230047CE|nr:uncharacterized protein BDF20DRAFT_862010 [Mycotypha africana]KAI8981608.1 hypothetical protein BDF20DRAFT_862010 [Mycotypha africana]
MTNRYIVEQVFGYFGLVFWSLQLAPQAYKTYRRGTSTGVSVWMMLIWSIAGVFMGVYNIGLDVSIGLWIQPQIFTFISCICVFQELLYQHQLPQWTVYVGFVITCVLLAALEVGLVYAYKRAEQVGIQGVLTLFGVLPVIFILAGFLPQYYEIFRKRRVVGVSHIFLAMDFSGSIFSIISLVFRDVIDYLDLANYIAIACFDVGILLLYYVFEWYQKRLLTNKDVYEDYNDTETAQDDKPSPNSTQP